MKASHLAMRDFERQPWRNGGGVTTQLAVEGDGPRWLWRLSVAEVTQSGPFSDFEGYERTIMLLQGDGMELRVEGRAPVMLKAPFEPFVFDGGAKTECTLVGGPVMDLNLMVARDRATGHVEVVEVDHFESEAMGAQWLLAYGICGRTIAIAGDVASRLNPGELLRLDEARGEVLELGAVDRHARVALIRIDAK